MPTTWWGKAIAAAYIAGYWIYVLAAAVTAWPQMALFDWWTYVAYQAALYGPFWPFIVLWQLVKYALS